MPRYFKRYESVTAVLNAARNNPYFYHEQARGEYARRGNDKEWCGGALALGACDRIMRGEGIDEGVEENAQKLLGKIDTSFRDRKSMQWLPSVVGAYPVVPEYLMGIPEDMRHRMENQDDRAPLKIYVEVSYSAGVSNEAIARRGTALAALAMRLAEERPVDFCAFAAWHPMTLRATDVIWTVPLATSPMGLREVLNVIASCLFSRPVSFNATNNVYHEATGNNFGPRECFPFSFECSEDRHKAVRDYFQMTDKDVLVTRGYLTDERLMRTDPVEWVHKQLEAQHSVEE